MHTRGALSWREVEAAVPDLAVFVRSRFEAHRHLVMATIRPDGSPRMSGTEVTFWQGELWVGAMAGSRRVADLRRDPRLEIHSGSDDPPAWEGDARISGVATVVDDEALKADYLAATGHDGSGDEPAPGPWDLVRVEITELMTVELTADETAVLVSSWRPGREIRKSERA